jgi:hypothetical protein
MYVISMITDSLFLKELNLSLFPFSLWSKNSLGGPAYDFEKYVVINGN